MKNWAIILIVGLLLPKAFGRGGELGNGISAYVNKISGLSLLYPSEWHFYSTESDVSFLSGLELSEEEFMLSVGEDRISKADSLNLLLNALRERFPERDWQPVKLAKFSGWISVLADSKTYYLLKAPGEILVIGHPVFQDIEKARKVQMAIDSLAIGK